MYLSSIKSYRVNGCFWLSPVVEELPLVLVVKLFDPFPAQCDHTTSDDEKVVLQNKLADSIGVVRHSDQI